MRNITYSVALAVLLVAGSAWAQVSAPPRYNEGPGIKLSDRLVLHPGVAVEGRYDSNVFATNASRGAPYLLVVGHVGLSTLSPQRLTDGDGKTYRPAIDFFLKGSVSGRIYLSGDDNVTKQSAVEAKADTALKLFPGRPFAFTLADNFARSVSSLNADSGATYPRTTNTGLARLHIKPGGGRLTFDVGYRAVLDMIDADAATLDYPAGAARDRARARLEATDSFAHTIDFIGKWRLLPKTAVLLEVTQQFISHFRATIRDSNNVDSKPLRLLAGVSGLLTPSFSVMLKAGYGNAFYDTGPSFNGPLFNAELGLALTSLKLRLGYNFGFRDSRWEQYYRSHRIFASYDQQVGRLVLLYLTGSFEVIDFEGSKIATTRSMLGSGTLGIDFQLLDWMYIGAGYQIDARTKGDPPAVTAVGLNAYVRHQVFGKVGVSY